MSTAWPLISAGEALFRLQRGARAVDVRSVKEFVRGSIPGFKCIPILNDEHRHRVGLAYKESGQANAIALGHTLVDPLRADLVREWREALTDVEPELRLLTCWRGGLRSQIAAEWCAGSGLSGARVEGGYKAMRAELLPCLAEPPPLLVLSGWTGAGKTPLLRSLSALGGVVDLEGLARHRGSAFGLALSEQQPTQQDFENALALAVWSRPGERVVEDESAMIGVCALPAAWRRAMLSAPLVWLDVEVSKRVANIYREYVEEPLQRHPRGRVRVHLLAGVDRLQKRLGGLRTTNLRKLMFGAFAQPEMRLEDHAPWIEMLLREYYDPAYEYSSQRQKREIIFRGDEAAVRGFLAERLADRDPRARSQTGD